MKCLWNVTSETNSQSYTFPPYSPVTSIKEKLKENSLNATTTTTTTATTTTSATTGKEPIKVLALPGSMELQTTEDTLVPPITTPPPIFDELPSLSLFHEVTGIYVAGSGQTTVTSIHLRAVTTARS
uniref:Uncharacterized protein n=1 Tax=Glossina pallidipes TaxID=7398 RepID=A0A1A9ZQJ0_GLOPL